MTILMMLLFGGCSDLQAVGNGPTDTALPLDTATVTDTGTEGDTATLPDNGPPTDAPPGTPYPSGQFDPSCDAAVMSFSEPSSDGAWFATRIDPPGAPYVLTGAEVTVAHGTREEDELPPCDAGQSFDVRLFVSSGDSPPVGVAPDAQHQFSADWIVMAGERVFLTIQTHFLVHPGDTEDEVTCIVACEEDLGDDFFTYEVDAGDWDWSPLPGVDLWMQIWGYVEP